MQLGLETALLTGLIGVGGVLSGVLLTDRLGRRAGDRRLADEDDRRWLVDRRQIYSQYLSLSEELLRQIDAVGVFLSYDGSQRVPEADEAIISEGLSQYMRRWDEELQPALHEVQLMASPEVSELADRVSGGLIEITAVIELRGTFVDYYPGWFQARDLTQVLRNAMRQELGLPTIPEGKLPRDGLWPWLVGRPGRESYVQDHPSKQPRM